MDEEWGTGDWGDDTPGWGTLPPPPPLPPAMPHPPGAYSGGPLDGCVVLSPDHVSLLKCLARITDSQVHGQRSDGISGTISTPHMQRRRFTGNLQLASQGCPTATATMALDKNDKDYIVSPSDFSVLFKSVLAVVVGPSASNDPGPPPPAWDAFDPFMYIPPPLPAVPPANASTYVSSDALDPFAAMAEVMEVLKKQNRKGKQESGEASQDKKKGSEATTVAANEDSNPGQNLEDVTGAAPASKFASLPKETLVRIFEYARQGMLSKKPAAKAAKNRRQARQNAGTSCGDPPASELKTPQIWLLSLRLVCQKWSPLVQSVAWSRLNITSDKLLDGVLNALEEQPEVASLIGESATIRMIPSPHGHPDPDMDWAYPTPVSPPAGDTNDEDEKTPEAKVAKFIATASALQKLKLITNRNINSRSAPFVSFMNSSLHNALCCSQLIDLVLDQCIVFADLELLLIQLKSLSTLILEGGTDSVDGRDDVTATEHEARLKHLKIRSFSGKVGPRQLSWILRPSVGYMQKLDITLPSRLVPFGLNADFDLGPQEVPQAFASAAFANLLVQFAPTLQILQIDSAGGNATVGNDLFAEPHLGNLDFALSHVRGLRKIRVPWSLTNSGFLEALAGSRNLTDVTLVGNAVHTSARDIMNRIEAGAFPKLQKITLLTFRLAMVNEGWNTRDMRAFLMFMKEKKIELVFS